MDNFVLGRYLPGNSIVHRMNPTNKLLLSFLFVLVVVFANNFASYFVLSLLVLGSVLICRIKIAALIKGIRPLLLVILFTVLIQILFTSGGTTYFHWGIIQVTSLGVQLSLFILIRFVLIVIVSTLFTLTTPPLAIAYGIEQALSPLKKLHVPVETLGMMISIALRFVPTLMEEITTIINAQKSRGMDFNSGGPIKRAKKFVPILIPLFISSFKHAEELATAMEARGYQSGMKRTRYHVYHWHLNDWLGLFLYLLVAVLVFLLRS